MIRSAELVDATAAELRRRDRAGRWTGPTAGLARGYVQTNVVILPAADADDFAEFCRLNDRPCPLVEQTAPGDPEPRGRLARRRPAHDVPRYRVFRARACSSATNRPTSPTCGATTWSVSLLGCSFTFEHALVEAGLPRATYRRRSQRADVSHLATPAARPDVLRATWS